MSQITLVDAFNKIEADMREGWDIPAPAGDEPENIIRGIPRLGMDAPYGAMRLDKGRAEKGAMLSRRHTLSIELLGRFPWPSDGTDVETAKVGRLNAMMSRIEAGSTYAGFMLPEVTDYDFAESDDPNEPVYEVTLTVSLQQDVPR